MNLRDPSDTTIAADSVPPFGENEVLQILTESPPPPLALSGFRIDAYQKSLNPIVTPVLECLRDLASIAEKMHVYPRLNDTTGIPLVAQLMTKVQAENPFEYVAPQVWNWNQLGGQIEHAVTLLDLANGCKEISDRRAEMFEYLKNIQVIEIAYINLITSLPEDLVGVSDGESVFQNWRRGVERNIEHPLANFQEIIRLREFISMQLPSALEQVAALVRGIAGSP